MLINFLKHKDWKLRILEVGGFFHMCSFLSHCREDPKKILITLELLKLLETKKN